MTIIMLRRWFLWVRWESHFRLTSAMAAKTFSTPDSSEAILRTAPLISLTSSTGSGVRMLVDLP